MSFFYYEMIVQHVPIHYRFVNHSLSISCYFTDFHTFSQVFKESVRDKQWGDQSIGRGGVWGIIIGPDQPCIVGYNQQHQRMTMRFGYEQFQISSFENEVAIMDNTVERNPGKLCRKKGVRFEPDYLHRMLGKRKRVNKDEKDEDETGLNGTYWKLDGTAKRRRVPSRKANEEVYRLYNK